MAESNLSSSFPVVPKTRTRDLTGQRFGRLTAVAFGGIYQMSGTTQAAWYCRCDCGRWRAATACALLHGSTKSCGCFRKEWASAKMRAQALTHGLSYKGEFRSWKAMVRRCTKTNSDQYERYGVRGITVCDRWLSSPENFIADMGPRPTSKHSIERIDNEKNYSPDNCRWATPKEQTRNTRSNHLVTYQGRTQCVAAWAEELGINPITLRWRLSKGWSTERALAHPPRNK